MTAAVLSSSSLCRGAHLWFFFPFHVCFYSTLCHCLCFISLVPKSSLLLVRFTPVSLLSFSSVRPCFVFSFCCWWCFLLSTMFFLLCNVFVEVLVTGHDCGCSSSWCCCCCWDGGENEVGLGLRWQRRLFRVQGRNGRERGMARRGTVFFLGALSLSRSKNTPPLLVFQPPPVQQNSPRFKLLPLSVSKSSPPPSLSAVLGAIYRASGCGFCCCAWERVSRRLVGHWVLLSRFGSNGMERGG